MMGVESDNGVNRACSGCDLLDCPNRKMEAPGIRNMICDEALLSTVVSGQ
jgi:hypothetical protein